MGYTLLVDWKGKTLKVSKPTVGMRTPDVIYTNDVKRYNESYFICLKRKPLKELAENIKAGWIADLEFELKRVKAIEIK